MEGEFYSLHRLQLAMNFAKDSIKDSFVPDYFRHQDFIHNHKRILADISIKLRNKQYRPHEILPIDIPKSGLSTRPGSIIEFSDLLVLFAAIYSFVEPLDSKLPKNVFSHRLNPKFREPGAELFQNREMSLLPIEKRRELRKFEQWYEAWPLFDAETRRIIDSEGFKHLVVSDITAYYENVHHEILRQILVDGYHSCYEINLLMNFLREWTVPLSDGYRISRGIPQGNAISAFLGNIYLLELDEAMVFLEKRHGIRYIRYMDDIKIFARELKDAKRALFKMNDVLRSLQLNVQGAKTDIYPRENFVQFIADRPFEKLNLLVDDILKTEHQRPRVFQFQIPAYLRRLREATSKLQKGKISKDNIRYFKRLLTGFTHIKKPELTYRCFSALEENPVLTAKIVKYFKAFKTGKKIPEVIFQLIAKGDLFDYQIARLAEVFWHKKEIPRGLVHTLLAFALDREKHWAIRVNSLITLSFFDLAVKKRKEINSLLVGESNYRIKRAILICMLQAPSEFRDRILEDSLCDTDYRVGLFCKFLRDIASDIKTQNYELYNLELIDDRLFVEESYKLLLLRESKDLNILEGLRQLLRRRKLKKSKYPYHIRRRIASTFQYVRARIRDIRRDGA